MYLVDTNVMSDVLRGAPQPSAWLNSVEPASLYLSVITLGEINKGAAMRARTDRRSAQQLWTWLDGLILEFGARILPITNRIAIEWGTIASKRTRGIADGLLAATALVHGLTLVTRNAKDFDDLALPLVDPWKIQH